MPYVNIYTEAVVISIHKTNQLTGNVYNDIRYKKI